MPRANADLGELGDVSAQLSSISENLLASYARLAQHAERVDRELVAANAELARRVAEVESLRAHLDAVLRALPCGVVVRRKDGAIVSANPSARLLLDAAEADLVQLNAHPVLDAATPEGKLHEQLHWDGTLRTFALRRSPLPDGKGDGCVVTIDDRTEEHQLGRRLAARSKMAALGTMAGGIAHEVRNPLNAVRGFSALLRRELEGTGRAHHFATRICQGVDEIDVIVESLLGFASPQKSTCEEIDAKALVAEAVEAARSERCIADRPERWTIESRVECRRFRGDRIKLRQALRNLIANSLQAQTHGGKVVVQVREERGDIELRVHDAGPGFPESLRGRAGEPFLTTRAEGTGLGLSLVHAIAAIHGGSFEIRSVPGPLGGADVRIRIPCQPS